MPVQKQSTQKSPHASPISKKPAGVHSQQSSDGGLAELLQRMARQGQVGVSASQVQTLQRNLGNQAVSRLVNSGQLQSHFTPPTIQRGPLDEEEIQTSRQPAIQRGPLDEEEIQTSRQPAIQRGPLDEEEIQTSRQPAIQRGPLDEEEIQTSRQPTLQAKRISGGSAALQRYTGGPSVTKTSQSHAIQRVTLPSGTPTVAWWNDYLFGLTSKSDWKMYSDPKWFGDDSSFDGYPVHVTVSADGQRSPGPITKSSNADVIINNFLGRADKFKQIHATLDIVKGDPESNPHYYWVGPGGQARYYDLRNESLDTLYWSLTNFSNNFIKPKVEEAINSAPA